MIGWLVFLAVGLGSYGFRVGPLLARRGASLPVSAERLIEHSGTAALTALVVSAVVHGDGAVPLPLVVAATAVGLVVAVRGGSILRVLAAGFAVVLTARLVAIGLVGVW